MNNISIVTLNVTNRVKNVLIRNKINTLEELSKVSIEELVAIKGLELLTIKEIATEMHKNGYTFEGYIDLNSFLADVIEKHREKTAEGLKKMIQNATPMPVYDEVEFQKLMEEIYDKTNKVVNPLSETETYFFREYLGVNQIIYNEGELLKLDPVYRVNKTTVKNMSMIRIIYSRFDNNELEMNETMTSNRLRQPIVINGIKIETMDDFSKITSIEFYDALFDMKVRYKFYLKYKELHDNGIYFKDELIEEKELDEDINKEIENSTKRIENLQKIKNQAYALNEILLQIKKENDERIKKVEAEILFEEIRLLKQNSSE